MCNSVHYQCYRQNTSMASGVTMHIIALHAIWLYRMDHHFIMLCTIAKLAEETRLLTGVNLHHLFITHASNVIHLSSYNIVIMNSTVLYSTQRPFAVSKVTCSLRIQCTPVCILSNHSYRTTHNSHKWST